jgi:hypothetical protein
MILPIWCHFVYKPEYVYVYVYLFSVAEGFLHSYIFNKPTQLALPLYIRKHKLVITVKK